MKDRKWIPVGIAILCILMAGVLGYLIWSLPDSEPVDLKLHASVISADSQAGQPQTLEVHGKLLRHRDGSVELDGDIRVSDGFRYKFHDMDHDPYRHEDSAFPGQKAFVSSLMAYDKDANRMEAFEFVLDAEKGYMVLRWQKSSYIVASADPNANPQEILDHFDWFVEKK